MRIKIIELEADASELKASNTVAGNVLEMLRHLTAQLTPDPSFEPEENPEETAENA